MQTYGVMKTWPFQGIETGCYAEKTKCGERRNQRWRVKGTGPKFLQRAGSAVKGNDSCGKLGQSCFW